jgi:hypothetical protein
MKCAEDTENAAEEAAVCSHTKEVSVMPKRDGTGPMGNGRMTGRGRGACNPDRGNFRNNEQGGRNAGRGSGQDRGSGRNSGRGFGQGRGSGKGRGNRR